MTNPFTRRTDAFGVRDVVVEAILGLAGRPGRLALTALVVVLGIGSLVATVGFAQTGARQVQARFDAVTARHGLVKPAADQAQLGAAPPAALPWDAAERATRLNGVTCAGTITKLDPPPGQVTASPVHDPAAAPTRQPQIMTATPGLLDAVRGHLHEGVWIDNFHEQRAERVAVLGVRAARLLGVLRVDNQPAIFIGATSFTVIGVVDQVEYAADLLDAVIVPQSTARATLGLTNPGELHVGVELGAGPILSGQIGLQLSSDNPSGYQVVMPPPMSSTRQQLTADVNSLFLILGFVALAIGGVTIAVVSSMAVMERRGEIGLRRAIGATRGAVAAQFVAESAILGLLGGLVGTAAGTLVVTVWSLARGWTPVLDVRLAVAAAVTGVVVGVVSGLIPASRAASLEPATALQEGT